MIRRVTIQEFLNQRASIDERCMQRTCKLSWTVRHYDTKTLVAGIEQPEQGSGRRSTNRDLRIAFHCYPLGCDTDTPQLLTDHSGVGQSARAMQTGNHSLADFEQPCHSHDSADWFGWGQSFWCAIRPC